ncbi:MAG: polynucleotide adenylyltransferase PcnB, partial [Treponema sp.]|nr:polynucleotide adenylyltransferase PcnB [Treponema sp.]
MRYKYSSGKDGRPVKKAEIYSREEHGIDPARVDGDAAGVVRRLRDAGYEAYIVGGAVRDLILGKKPKDFDIATNASPMQIRRLFRNSRVIGRRFKLAHVYFGHVIYEVSTFRAITDGHDGNVFGTIEDDVMRRDFTMNALFYDPEKRSVVDYVGGMKDIRAKRVRAIIPLATIFTEDPVRMIRAVKYGATTGFSLPLLLKWKIKKQASLLSSVSPSRLTEEMLKIVNSSYASQIVDALESAGLYAYLQPGAARLMRTSPSFRERYLRSLAALNDKEYRGRPGEAVGALISDFLEDTTDLKLGANENYKATYAAARSFVLPINPPRFELDHAVRRFFSNHGMQVRKARLMDRPSQKAPPSSKPSSSASQKTAPKTLSENPATQEGAPRPKRRRRRPKPKTSE